MNRTEIWEAVVDAIEERFLRTEFGDGEFEVHVNRAFQQITIVERSTRQAETFLRTTGSHNVGFEPVHVVLPTGALAERLAI